MPVGSPPVAETELGCPKIRLEVPFAWAVALAPETPQMVAVTWSVWRLTMVTVPELVSAQVPVLSAWLIT